MHIRQSFLLEFQVTPSLQLRGLVSRSTRSYGVYSSPFFCLISIAFQSWEILKTFWRLGMILLAVPLSFAACRYGVPGSKIRVFFFLTLDIDISTTFFFLVSFLRLWLSFIDPVNLRFRPFIGSGS